jgi:ABC-type nitrate/sulfonate/bicarbonate transport system substrate-binding protein
MTPFLQKLFKPTSQEVVTVVSGLPRSGTSMMMKMLDAGGIRPLTDEIRTADKDNPKGYYEYERVKKLDEGDTEWVEQAQGKAVKVISALLKYLPQDYTYKVIFMLRNMDEILASQRQMLMRRGEPSDSVSDEELAELFRKHLAQIQAWIDEQPNAEAIYVSYNEVVEDPLEQARTVNRFLGDRLDVEHMVQVVDEALYRQRG